MAVEVIKNTGIYVDGYNITGDSNRVEVGARTEILDRTCFGSSARRRKAGLFDWNLSVSGFHNSSAGAVGTTYGKSDPVAFNMVGFSSAVVSIIPGGTNRGNPAYFGKAAGAEYSPSGRIGDLFGFTLAAQGNDRLVRGKLMEAGEFSTDSKISGVPSTIQDLGPCLSTATGRFYVALHLLGSTGGTLNISIRLSSATNMGAATTMIKWTAVTATGGQSKFATTKVPSTKKQYAKVYSSTGSQSGVNLNAVLVAGMNNKV